MQDIAEALSIKRMAPSLEGAPLLSHNQKPLDTVLPAGYPSPTDSREAKQEAQKLVQQASETSLAALTTPRFVARAVFRSLVGTWRLERDLVSRLPSHPSGHFSGTARFLLRERTADGMQCAGDAAGGAAAPGEDDAGMEYVYVEEGEFKTDGGFGFRATRRYVWRYDERRDRLSVWFARADDEARADYLFHEMDFEQPGGRDAGWRAKAGHLCVDDYYDVGYRFAFAAVRLRDWSVEYTVKGPRKDYSIRGRYERR